MSVRPCRTGVAFGLIVGATLLGMVVALALLAPILSPAEPTHPDLAGNLAPPSLAHPLGQDKLGRDVLARLLFGTRLSLGIAGASVLGALLIGVGFATLASSARHRLFDALLMRATDVFLAFPGLLLAIALAAVLGPSARNVVLALTVLGWPAYARLARGEFRSAAKQEYNEAAVALGGSSLYVALRHLLPAALPALIVQATFGFASAILAESSLSFLGLGVPSPAPSWGAMLAEGRSFMLVAPHLILAPGATIFVVVLAVQLIGEALAGGRRSARH